MDFSGLIQSLFCQSYIWIFNHEPNEFAHDFFKNIIHIATGMIISLLFLVPYTILTTRILGPDNYGHFVLVQSTALILSTPMILGFSTAHVKYVSECRDDNQRSRIISTTYMIILILVVLTSISCVFLAPRLSSVFSIPYELFMTSVLFAACYSLYAVSTGTLNGLFKMKTVSRLQILYPVLLLLFFSILVMVNLFSYYTMILLTLIAYGVIIFLTMVILKKEKFLSFSFDLKWAKTLGNYAIFAAVGGVSYTILTNIDKILLNRYSTPADVGIYSAYFVSVNIIPALFSGIFGTVLFPSASKHGNKSVFFDSINTFSPYLIFGGIPLSFAGGLVFLTFFGNKYPIVPPLLVLFSTGSVLMAWYVSYGWLLNSLGPRGVKVTISCTTCISIINFVLNTALIPRFGLYGAVCSMIIAFSIGIMTIFVYTKRILCSP